MEATLAVFSAILVVFTLAGVAQPARTVALVRRFMAGPGIAAAIAIRLALAALLWLCAQASRTPLAFQLFAALLLLSAVSLPFIGRSRLLGLMDVVSSWPALAIRAALASGALIGAFLLWSVWPGLGLHA